VTIHAVPRGTAPLDPSAGTSTAKKLIRGSIFRNINLFAALAAAFVMAPFIVHSLGTRMYGFWTLIGAFIGYYGVLDFGLSSASARYISRSLGKGDVEELNNVVNTAFFLYCLIGLAALVATVAVVLACPFFMHDPAEMRLFRKIFLLLGVATAAGFPLRVYSGILTSYIRYDSLAYISIARTLISNVAIYCCLSRGHGIMAMAVIAFTVSLTEGAAICAACTAQVPHIKIAWFRFEGSKIRAMFDHSWKTFVCMMSTLVRFGMDSAVIAYFLNVSLITPYAVGVRIADGFNNLVLNFVGMMLPVFSRYEGSGDYDAIRSALVKITRFSALLSAFLGLSIMFYAQAFILRWMGPGFDSSRWVAAILTFGFMLHLPQSPGVQVLYALSKHERYAALNVCEGAANLILSVILLKHYGIYGVALGTAIEMVIFKLLVQPVYICRVVGMPVREYLVDIIFATMLKSAVPLGLYFFLIRGLVLPEYPRLCACVALQTVLFVPAAYFFIISKAERELVDGLIASLLKRPSMKTSEGTAAA
jgi:O-antigen/teichoic acid export membrane protein